MSLNIRHIKAPFVLIIFCLLLSKMATGNIGATHKFNIFEDQPEFPLTYSMYYNKYYSSLEKQNSIGIKGLWRNSYERLGVINKDYAEGYIEDAHGIRAHFDIADDLVTGQEIYNAVELGITEKTSGSYAYYRPWINDVQIIYQVDCTAYYSANQIFYFGNYCMYQGVIEGIKIRKTDTGTIEYYDILDEETTIVTSEGDADYRYLQLNKIVNTSGIKHTLIYSGESFIVQHSNGNQLLFDNNSVTFNNNDELRWTTTWEEIPFSSSNGERQIQRLLTIEKVYSNDVSDTLLSFEYFTNDFSDATHTENNYWIKWSVLSNFYQNFQIYKNKNPDGFPLEFSLRYNNAYTGKEEPNSIGKAGLWRHNYERWGAVWENGYYYILLIEDFYGKLSYVDNDLLFFFAETYEASELGIQEGTSGIFEFPGQWRNNAQAIYRAKCTAYWEYIYDPPQYGGTFCQIMPIVGINIRNPETGTVEHYDILNKNFKNGNERYYYLRLSKITNEDGFEQNLIYDADGFFTVIDSSGVELRFEDNLVTLTAEGETTEWEINWQEMDFQHIYDVRTIQRVSSVQKIGVETETLLQFNYLTDDTSTNDYWYSTPDDFWIKWSALID